MDMINCVAKVSARTKSVRLDKYKFKGGLISSVELMTTSKDKKKTKKKHKIQGIVFECTCECDSDEDTEASDSDERTHEYESFM